MELIMKLISMIDFVSIFYNDLKSEYKVNWGYDQICNKIFKYANFLKQPLKLEMFVPCDEDGDILDEPENYEQRLPNMMTEYNDEVYRYKQAKSKVLFEGFRINGEDENIITLEFENTWIEFHKEHEVFMCGDYVLINIEDLSDYKLQLTESALKQIEQ